MTSAYDRIYGLEHDLAKYPPGVPHSALERRLVLRKALKEHADEAFAVGYTEGMRDARDAARADRELASRQEDSTDG